MNIVIYNLLNKIHNPRILDEKYLESLYQFYEDGSEKYNYKIDISKNEFGKIFSTIYDVLGLRINEEEFEIVIEHYLKLLMADAIDGHNVDLNWSIDHIWYLCIGIQNGVTTEKYKDCIPFLQQRLVKEFDIEENIKEKVSRKIYTRFMAK